MKLDTCEPEEVAFCACCSPERWLWSCAAAAEIGASAAAAILLEGAGATFPAPLYKQWIKAYAQGTAGGARSTTSRRQRRGRQALHRRRGGLRRQRCRDERRADRSGAGGVRSSFRRPPAWSCWPTTCPACKEPLKLPRDVYVDILPARSARWNDPRITPPIPDSALPKRDIAHRRAPGQQRHHLRVHESSQRDQRRLARPGPGHRQGHRLAGQRDDGARQRGRRGADQDQRRGRSATSNTATPSVWAWRWRVWRTEPVNLSSRRRRPAQAAFTEMLAQMPENLRLFLPDPAGRGILSDRDLQLAVALRALLKGAGRACGGEGLRRLGAD